MALRVAHQLIDEAANPPEETPLQHRLREMRWPEPPPGVRERGLQALRERLSELSDEGRRPEGQPPR